MLERNITRAEVKRVLRFGDIIEYYAHDQPFPSALLCITEGRPLHVVAALDVVNKLVHIITVYRPDITHFAPDFKTRIKR
ncbi:MAG: DUF4258 domain-containing protein [Gallionella sp.]|nr:MAG: DUF4258 domain-containing protein [Gallionella sp.]